MFVVLWFSVNKKMGGGEILTLEFQSFEGSTTPLISLWFSTNGMKLST